MICKRCGSANVFVAPVVEQRPRGCLLTLFYIILLCIPILGWIALFFLIRGRRSKTVTYAVLPVVQKAEKAVSILPAAPFITFYMMK